MGCPCSGVSSPSPLRSRLARSPHHPGVCLLLDFSHSALSQLPGPAHEGLAWPLAIAWQGCGGCEDTPPHQVSVQVLQGVCGAVRVGHLLASEDPPTACPSPRATPSCSGWLVKRGAICTALNVPSSAPRPSPWGAKGRAPPPCTQQLEDSKAHG